MSENFEKILTQCVGHGEESVEREAHEKPETRSSKYERILKFSGALNLRTKNEMRSVTKGVATPVTRAIKLAMMMVGSRP